MSLIDSHHEDGPSTIVEPRTGRGADLGDVRSELPALTILWHPDLRCVGRTAALDRGVTEISRWTAPFEPASDVIRAGGVDAPVLSRAPFLFTEYRDGAVRLRPGTTKTTVSVDGVALTRPLDIAADDLRRGVIITLADRIVVCLHQIRFPVLRGPSFGLIGDSDVMEDVRRHIDKVAGVHDVPVLIRGETGTGKELVARAIAAHSGAASPFVAVSMADISPSTAVAELFGHERGAFTGATEARPGLFAEADGGTLFLDEIAATPIEVQKSLLRVIQEGVIRPVGARRERRVRVRIVTATDKNLEAAVARGTFERPLFGRIMRYQIVLPPLRERRSDIGILFLHFLRERLDPESERLALGASAERPWLEANDFARIARSDFPENVRTLSAIADRLAISSGNQRYAQLDAVIEQSLSSSGASRALPVHGQPSRSPAPARRPQGADDKLRHALELHNYNVAAAAHELGIHRSTVYDWIRTNPGIIRRAESLAEDEIVEAYERHGGDVAKIAADLRVSPKPLKTRIVDVLRLRRASGD